MTKDVLKFEEEFGNKKGIVLFGKNLSEIKCFRKSFLYGISGGVFAGLVCFMVTSKARLSSHVGFGSMCFGVLAYWFPCRYKYESQVLQMEYLKREMASRRIVHENKSPNENNSGGHLFYGAIFWSNNFFS